MSTTCLLFPSPIKHPKLKFLDDEDVLVIKMSPNPANERIVFFFPPSANNNSFISFILSVKNNALVEGVAFIPSSIPEAIAITFFILPHTSTPIMSFVLLNLVSLFSKHSLTSNSTELCFVARLNPIGTSRIISTAKEGPEITAILFLQCFLKTSCKNKHVSCCIPFVAINTGCLLSIHSFNLITVLSKENVGTAITIKSFPLTTSFILLLKLIHSGIL